MNTRRITRIALLSVVMLALLTVAALPMPRHVFALTSHTGDHVGDHSVVDHSGSSGSIDRSDRSGSGSGSSGSSGSSDVWHGGSSGSDAGDS